MYPMKQCAVSQYFLLYDIEEVFNNRHFERRGKFMPLVNNDSLLCSEWHMQVSELSQLTIPRPQ